MKLGILGTGKIVAELLPVIKENPNIELVAICARNEEKLRKIQANFEIKKIYTSIDALLADSEVDVVYVGLPNNMHYEVMKEAIAASKDIICEKPFAVNIDQAKETARLAEKANIIAIEAVTHRFIPNAIRAKEMIGELGEISIISLNYSQYSSRYDDFINGIIAPVFSADAAGGALMDLNLYNISFVVDTFGKPKSEKYYPNMENGIDTSGLAVLDYGSFKASLIGAKDTEARVLNTIQADEKTLFIPDAVNTFSSFSIVDNKSKETYEFNYNIDGKSRLYYEFEEFVRIFKERDYNKANLLMAQTLAYIEVLTKLRADAGIIFPADKNL